MTHDCFLPVVQEYLNDGGGDGVGGGGGEVDTSTNFAQERIFN